MNLHLIDGFGFIFRAYHSLPPLLSPDGTAVSAVYGFTNMLLKLLASYNPDMIAVALDNGHKTHRYLIFEDYKAHRPAVPEDLKIQFPLVRDALRALNITILEDNRYEADDLIASYALKAVEAGHKVTIVSSDKDLMQLLIYPGIEMRCPMKDKQITHEYVQEKFGISVGCLTDFLALVGDKSDNIPGVPGIGPKTAALLLNQYGSVAEIYQSIPSVKQERIRNLLLNHKEGVELALDLVRLKKDIVIGLEFNDLKVQNINQDDFKGFAEKFGFQSLLNKILNIKPQSSPELKKYDADFYQINSLSSLESALESIPMDGIFGLYFNKEKLFLFTKFGNFFLKYQENILLKEEDCLFLHQVLELLRPLLESKAYKKICFNSKELIKILKTFECGLESFEDISLMMYLINSKNQYKDLFDLLKDEQCQGLPILELYQDLLKRLIAEGLIELYEKIEKPLVRILSHMEHKGVFVDINTLKTLAIEFHQRSSDIEQEIYQIAGESFNIGSPKQLGLILFDKMGIFGGKKSRKTGHYTTDSDVLEILAESNPIAELVLEWRRLTKLLNTYIYSLQKSINDSTGKVHTTFEMTATTTGRLSSRHPNLQNIPIKSIEGKKIRKAFTASSGHCLISADYSQIELRLLAHIADIKELKDAFKNDSDIHAVTASEIFQVPQAEVTEELRSKAKAINFGIIYGISPFGLARNIGISNQAAKQYIEYYFKRYPGIKEYMSAAIEFAKRSGFIKTIMGRKCSIDGINSSNYAMRSFAERAAINAPLQGSAADIIKKAMNDIPQSVSQYMTLQIHDELLFEVPEELVEKSIKLIRDAMENVVILSIPLKIDIISQKFW